MSTTATTLPAIEVLMRRSNSNCEVVEHRVITILPTLVNEVHYALEKAYPDCFINFVWGAPDQLSFICGMRYGQALDEKRLDAGEITWEEYCAKWF